MKEALRFTPTSVIYHTLHFDHKIDTMLSANLQRSSQQVLWGRGTILAPMRLDFASNVGRSSKPCFHTSPDKSDARNLGGSNQHLDPARASKSPLVFLPNSPLLSFFNVLNQASFKEN